MKNKKRLVNPFFYLEKPNEKKVNGAKIAKAIEDKQQLLKLFSKANSPKYIYWDTFKHKHFQTDLNPEEQWLLVRSYRDVSSIKTPIKTEDGANFIWFRLPTIDEKLHKIDMATGGRLFAKSKIPTQDKEVYISRGVIEEAIASSQLEGAHTTRAAAKKLILEKRKPKNKSEQMIINNYHAMILIEEEFRSRKLSREFLYELHSILTEKTLDLNQQKRFRNDSDKIVVEGEIGNERYTAYIPPNQSFLENEIDRLIAYANDELDEKFIHPIIKAIFIHFWIGYLHPFVDGNGRLARALFYWYLLKNEYWTFSYLPISTVIKKSVKQYAMSYIYSEQDSNDITYFFDYNLRKITQAMNDFNTYAEKQINQNQRVENTLNSNMTLNERQKQLVFYFLSEENGSTTTTTHSTLNNISRQTAAKDLKYLEDNHLIKAKREGKYIRYYSTKKLKKLKVKL